MKKYLTFKNVEVILGKDVRVKIDELKVQVKEIRAIHHSEDDKYVLALTAHYPGEDKDSITKCLAFYISKADYEDAVPVIKQKQK